MLRIIIGWLLTVMTVGIIKQMLLKLIEHEEKKVLESKNMYSLKDKIQKRSLRADEERIN